MAKQKGQKKERLELGLIRKLVDSNLRKKDLNISDTELDFFKNNPFELDRLTSTVTTKKVYLIMAVSIGLAMVALSIFIKVNFIGAGGGLFHGFITELLFEGGVALWGASFTVYMLEIMMSRQDIINHHYRREVRRKLQEMEEEE